MYTNKSAWETALFAQFLHMNCVCGVQRFSSGFPSTFRHSSPIHTVTCVVRLCTLSQLLLNSNSCFSNKRSSGQSEPSPWEVIIGKRYGWLLLIGERLWLIFNKRLVYRALKLSVILIYLSPGGITVKERRGAVLKLCLEPAVLQLVLSLWD